MRKGLLCLPSVCDRAHRALNAAPSAKEILASVRMQQASAADRFAGAVATGQRPSFHFEITQSGPCIGYSSPIHRKHCSSDSGKKIRGSNSYSAAGSEKIAPAQFDRKVRGTAVTYEDLALKFLYWPKAQIIGEENINTRSCWKLQLTAPSRQSQYSSVFLWVDKTGGALMRLEGFAWDGKLAKRFHVISGQKIDGRWFLKQMRIEEMQPGTNKVQSRTYLEIKKPSAAG